MKALIKNLHIFLFAYFAYQGWLKYNEIVERKVQIQEKEPVIRARIGKLKRQKKEINDFLLSIAEAKKRIELVATEVEKIQKKLPTAISDAQNLEFIKKVAEGLNIKNIYLSPRDEKNEGFYITKKYEFKASGTFLQFLIFLEKIGDAEQLLNIGEVKIEKSTNPQKGRFQVVNYTAMVESFRYNENYKEDRGIEAIEQKFSKPTAPKNPRRRGRGKGADDE
ncbi:pilus assembly protein, PilO [Bacteriovorax sp. BSW11_IV]|uniref:type 4a pilus biogenesis protein PilO n=1 Tax=Bacteriovorax sp. BSW11_IV TaxID=1353529 RepID=UPI00038A0416|nr:type 4a pilus biogenesis protein PilO [Bacteriovorax sp. BSW11_IV]EQC47004.1 pilus assembly protein, PilO [Bacteriovorax sp. BSW11_IV]